MVDYVLYSFEIAGVVVFFVDVICESAVGGAIEIEGPSHIKQY